MTQPINRRSFLRTTAAGVAGVSLAPRSWAQVAGANSDIRVAVVGFNGRGQNHIDSFRKVPGVRLVALCDVDSRLLEGAAKKASDKKEQLEVYTDIRKLLEKKDLDAISIATPNHWHSLMAIWGCQAGKDVYVEKPVSHNVFEGRKVVEAARKYKRVVQTGTQSRSDTAIRTAFEWIKEGNIGKIRIARGLCYKRRPSIGKVSGPQPIPADIDYDLWCGPAPKEPLMRKNLHYDWHWVWPTGNGDLGNQGIHQMDIARWALGKDRLSPKILSIGGRLGYVDDGETANTQMVVHDYGDAMLIFEVRGLPHAPDSKDMDKFHGQSIGNIIECDGGYVAGTTAFDNDHKEIKKFAPDRSGDTSHFANFIEVVRSRRVQDLRADILEGHLSSALCHTGNISYRLGQATKPEEMHEKIKGNKAAAETLGRMEEHLAANNVDLKATPLTYGAFLQMDPIAEAFISNEEANKMLTRKYRAPYVVPAKV